ncbi:T9SS type A sorting domain-containing protein [bacterium]|nr:T9SS type A sorting domain-containing protein [bacterium]
MRHFSDFLLTAAIFLLINTTLNARIVFQSHPFSEDTTYAEPSRVEQFDINSDGYADVFFNSYNRTHFFINDGNGEFAEFFPTERSIRWLVCADFDHDGDNDFVIDSDSLIILEQVGDLEFEEIVLDFASFSKLTVADINNDELPDLLMYSSEPSLFYLQNNGDMTFAASVISEDETTPYSIQPIDFNNDGFLDFIGSSNDVMGWWEGNGEGEFVEHIIADTLSRGIHFKALDLDNDGDIDFFTSPATHDGYPTTYRWVNRGDNENFYQEAIYTQPETGDIHTLATVDINRDGIEDLLTGNYRWSDWSLSYGALVWHELDFNGDIVSSDVLVHDGAYFAVPAFINADDNVDFFCTLAGRRMLINYLAWMEWTESDYEVSRIALEQPFTSNPQLYDFDEDGDQDLIVITSDNIYEYDARLLWYRNDGNGAYNQGELIEDSLGFSLEYTLADFEGDGDVDFLLSNDWSGRIRILKNQGNETFTLHLLPFESEIKSCYTDLDSDGDIDIVGVLGDPEEDADLVWWENRDGVEFAEPVAMLSHTTVQATLKPVDIDGDGDLDLLSVNQDQFYYFVQVQPFRFEKREYNNLPPLGSYWYDDIAIKDIDLDGDIDLYNQHDLYLNDGEGYFEFQEINPPTEDLRVTRAPKIIDLDGDGDLDLLGKYLESTAWYENDGNLNFETHLLDNEKFTSAAVGDIDGDPELEIIGCPMYGGGFLVYDTTPLFNVKHNQSGNLPNTFTLSAPYPNPFNSTLRATFSLPQKGDVSIHLFDILGRDVGKVVQGTFQPGKHHFYLDAKGLASGTYFLRAETENGLQTSQKVILVR